MYSELQYNNGSNIFAWHSENVRQTLPENGKRKFTARGCQRRDFNAAYLREIQLVALHYCNKMC